MKRPVLTGGVFDPNFKYTPANRTNIAKTFDRLQPGWRKKWKNSSAPVSTAITAEPTTSSPAAIGE